jgi:4-alpha-glucanotransferase
MHSERRSGLLLHVTALPGPDGIGTFGEGARAFVDFLADCGGSVWQVCPLGPTEGVHGHSPYSSPSAFAGNPLLVALNPLVEAGWLDAGALDARPVGDRHRVRFDAVREFKRARLEAAFEGFQETATDAEREAFEAFRERETDWLADYTLYVALKAEFDGDPWTEWPASLRDREAEPLAAARERHAATLDYHAFVQWLFDRQWRALHDYAAKRGVEVVGDMPLYVAADGADVWANRDTFDVGSDGHPAAVAGVPPDMDDSGQRWGNPLYDWDHLRETGFAWWRRRFDRMYDLFDVVRLDHFKGFEQFWAIPADADSPTEGEWHEAAGHDLFAAVREDQGGLPAIAEDLGHVTEGMEDLRTGFDLPGMRVPQYADWCAEHHMYKPRDYPADVVAYTGSHDTDTVVGWYDGLDERQRECLHYALETDGSDVHWSMLEAVWRSDARLAVAPVQDLLGLDSHARFNTPGTTDGNWDWRVNREALEDGLAAEVSDLTERTDRARGD